MRVIARARFAVCLLAAGLLPGAAQAEEGQYRSKILIDPGGALEEGVTRSVEQLEQQLAASSDPYARSSVGRQLARHYAGAGQYERAVGYYQAALDAGGLSPIADRQMLRELAQVYLLGKDYGGAAEALERALQLDLVPEAGDFLLLAQARYQQGDYVAVVDSLDRMQAAGLALDAAGMRRALGLYYQAGAYPQCAGLLLELLAREPDNPENWHQLAAIYLLLDKPRQALDQLALAYEKGVPFREQDILLLANLHAVNGNPYGAGLLIGQAATAQTLSMSGEHYRKQFQFWLQAQEREHAIAALQSASRLTGDTELYLYLAQLQREQEDWPAMQDTLTAACDSPLDDKYVGRANLLLGISQLKLGDAAGARRSFINATLIGGAQGRAAQWLRYMEAEPTTDAEARKIAGLCRGAGDKRGKLTPVVARPDQGSGESPEAAEPPPIKTISQRRYLTATYPMSPDASLARLEGLGTRLAAMVVRGDGETDGPLHLIFEQGVEQSEEVQLALPVRGNPRGSGHYRALNLGPFRCAYRVYRGAPDGLAAAWSELVQDSLSAGYLLTGQGRLVLESGGQGMRTELQLGVR